MGRHATAGDEAGAAQAAAVGDERLDPLQKILVAGAASRVPQIARALKGLLGGINVDDCMSAGYEALVRAALRYEPASGVPFMAFAYQRVRGAMLDAIRQTDPGRRRLRRLVRAAEAAASVTEANTPVAGDPRTLAERVAAAAAMVRDVTAAVLLAQEGDFEELGDPQGEDLEARLVDAETRGRLKAALARCKPDERALFDGLYFRGETMATVAGEQGISVATVSRRHARALRRLAALVGKDER